MPTIARPLWILLPVALLLLGACRSSAPQDAERLTEIAPDFERSAVREIALLPVVVPSDFLEGAFGASLSARLREYLIEQRFYSVPASEWVERKLAIAPTPPEQANGLLGAEACLLVTVEELDERLLATRGSVVARGRAELWQDGRTLWTHRFARLKLIASAPYGSPAGRDDALREIADGLARAALESLPPKAFR